MTLRKAEIVVLLLLVSLGCSHPHSDKCTLIDFEPSLVVFRDDTLTSDADESNSGTDTPFERVLVTRWDNAPRGICDPSLGLTNVPAGGILFEKVIRSDELGNEYP